MRVTIPSFEKKAALFSYLKENKKTLIQQKKSMPIFSDVCKSAIVQTKDTNLNTKGVTEVTEDLDVLRVKVVANTANWLDSHLDVLLPDASSKSINERKGIIPHLHDHQHTIEAKVGEVHDIMNTTLTLRELGIDKDGTTQALVFITDIIKDYNEKVFNQYKKGFANQHSIGLQYVKLDLALNDEDSTEEYKVWNSYINQVINRDKAEQYGFFWAVKEFKLIENSVVLFGSNEITPTLDNNMKTEPLSHSDIKNEPSNDTRKNKYLHLL